MAEILWAETDRSARRFADTLEAGAACVGAVRHAVGEHLARWGLGLGADEVVLVVGELLANAVRHGSREGDLVMVEVSHRPGEGEVMVAVTDRAPWDCPMLRVAGPEAEGGRGMAIVAALTTSWGLRVQAGAKTVWGRLPVAVAEVTQ